MKNFPYETEELVALHLENLTNASMQLPFDPLFLLYWFGSGLLLSPIMFGMEFAFWQRRFPALAKMHYKLHKHQALASAILVACLPPLIIIAFLFFGHGKYGLKFK